MGRGWAAQRVTWPGSPASRGLACSASPLVLHNITRGVLETIVEQAPFAIEDLMNELDAQEEDTLEGDEQEQGFPSRKPPEGEAHGTCGRDGSVMALLGPLSSAPAVAPMFLPSPPESGLSRQSG